MSNQEQQTKLGGGASASTAMLERTSSLGALDVIPVAEYYEFAVRWSCDPNEIASGTDLYTEHQLQKAVFDAVSTMIDKVDAELEGHEAPNSLRDHIRDTVMRAFGLRSNVK